jgi:hypothetical protein
LQRIGQVVPRAEADAALQVLRAKWAEQGAFHQRALQQHRVLR